MNLGPSFFCSASLVGCCTYPNCYCNRHFFPGQYPQEFLRQTQSVHQKNPCDNCGQWFDPDDIGPRHAFQAMNICWRCDRDQRARAMGCTEWETK